MQQIRALSLSEIIEEGAPADTGPYLEMLLDALEDGDISESESSALADLISAYGLTPELIAATHSGLLLALAHRAVDDGHVSRLERAELNAIADLLSVPTKRVLEVIKRADSARVERMSVGLKDLPSDWPHGEPLRVGDRVAFTGCDELQRERLEKRAEKLGVRVLGNVSRLTVMLVTDGMFSGTKAAKASEHATRVVHPDHFDLLLAHLQPARATVIVVEPLVEPQSARSHEPATIFTVSATASPSAIRTWALSRGYEVGIRGRLPAEVVEAYESSVDAQ